MSAVSAAGAASSAGAAGEACTADYNLDWVVYLGNGPWLYRQIGNANLRELVRSNIDSYVATAYKSKAKSALVDHMYDCVHANGGCFAKWTDDSPQSNTTLHEVSPKDAKKFIVTMFNTVNKARKKTMTASTYLEEIRKRNAGIIADGNDPTSSLANHGTPASSEVAAAGTFGTQTTQFPGSTYTLQHTTTPVDENPYFVQHDIALSDAQNPSFRWTGQAVSSTQLPTVYRLIFLAIMILQVLVLVWIREPWKFVLIICKMFPAAPYIKTRPIDLTSDNPNLRTWTWLVELAELYRQQGFLLIVQLYDGNESTTEEFRANSIHHDDHSGYQKMLLRTGGIFDLYADFLPLPRKVPFFQFDCQENATVMLGTDEFLGIKEVHGKRVEHSVEKWDEFLGIKDVHGKRVEHSVEKWDARPPKPQQATARAEKTFDEKIAAVDLAQKAGEFHFAQRSSALAKWVHNARQDKKRGLLSEERIRKLDEIGFCWTVERAAERLNEFRKAL